MNKPKTPEELRKMVATYYMNLRAGGVPEKVASKLTVAFQNSLLITNYTPSETK